MGEIKAGDQKWAGPKINLTHFLDEDLYMTYDLDVNTLEGHLGNQNLECLQATRRRTAVCTEFSSRVIR